jgi:hypothetical protein
MGERGTAGRPARRRIPGDDPGASVPGAARRVTRGAASPCEAGCARRHAGRGRARGGAAPATRTAASRRAPGGSRTTWARERCHGAGSPAKRAAAWRARSGSPATETRDTRAAPCARAGRRTWTTCLACARSSRTGAAGIARLIRSAGSVGAALAGATAARATSGAPAGAPRLFGVRSMTGARAACLARSDTALGARASGDRTLGRGGSRSGQRTPAGMCSAEAARTARAPGRGAWIRCRPAGRPPSRPGRAPSRSA